MTRIVRSIENYEDKSFIVLTYGDGKIARSISGSQLTDMQCSSITDAMQAMDKHVQRRLYEDGARLEYEGHVQIDEIDGPAGDSITLHDQPFTSISSRGPRWGVFESDDGTDIGKILREMMGAGPYGTVAFRGRVVVEILDKTVEER